jgi:hypothetical protein
MPLGRPSMASSTRKGQSLRCSKSYMGGLRRYIRAFARFPTIESTTMGSGAMDHCGMISVIERLFSGLFGRAWTK